MSSRRANKTRGLRQKNPESVLFIPTSGHRAEPGSVERLKYLESLVNEFRCANLPEYKEQVRTTFPFMIFRSLQIWPSNSTELQADPTHSSRLLSLSVASLTNLISSSQTIRKDLFTSGAVPLLTNCLQSSDPEVVVNALTSLVYLCTPTSQTPALDSAGVKTFQASLSSLFPGLCERVRSLTRTYTPLPDRRIPILAEIFLTDCSGANI
ncbi:unnamed protein product [Dibothriocephalus latus]|uniref:Armadillo repeat-containing domain-containing protein n=1 Tax=Dibothriocephalus latus TaxID=60516 RepID=A0A3P7M0E2_DIBLA|nr:unnamed protein product [Dibothriocephalus latus]